MKVKPTTVGSAIGIMVSPQAKVSGSRFASEADGDGTASHLVDGDVVAVDLPLSVHNQVFCRHGSRQSRIPTSEGITLTCRVGDRSDISTKGEGILSQDAITIHVSDGVVVHAEGSGHGHILCGHHKAAVRGLKGVARYSCNHKVTEGVSIIGYFRKLNPSLEVRRSVGSGADNAGRLRR